jgi:hypothetical protein
VRKLKERSEKQGRSKVKKKIERNEKAGKK